MNRQRTAFAASALALPLLVAFGARADKLAFSPEDGSSIDKSLSMDMSFYVEHLSMIMDGQDMGGMAMAEMDEAISFNFLIDVTDEYVSTANGKHVELLRTYNKLFAEAGTESEREEAEGMDELEDETILFKWNEEEGVYEKSFHESEGDEDLLSELEVDMDLTALLPDEEVGEGDTWEMAGEEALSLFAPGGFPGGGGGEDSEEAMELFQQELQPQLEEAFGDFAIECTFVGQRTEGDATYGEIAFEFEGEGAIDMSDMLMALFELQMEGQDVEVDLDITANLDMSFEGTGTLLWDQAAGTLYSYSMSCEMMILADINAAVDVMGEAHEMEASAEVSGTGEWAMTTGGDAE